MLSNKTFRVLAGMTCLMMIAMPVSAQLGAPGVPGVPAPAVPAVPAGVPAPALPATPALPSTPAGDVVTVDQRGNAVTVCGDATDAHSQAAGHLATAEAQADAATQQVKDVATGVTGSLPAAPVAHPDVPDATELGLQHCVDANADDPQGTAMGAAGQAQGILGTIQSWITQAASLLPF